jgi:hypothetical protein
MAMKAILARGFAPLNCLAIYGYPHPVPQIDEWEDLLPIFYKVENDNPIEHVHEFHVLMQPLDIHHEDILMKMFMYSVETFFKLFIPKTQTFLFWVSAFHKA